MTAETQEIPVRVRDMLPCDQDLELLRPHEINALVSMAFLCVREARSGSDAALVDLAIGMDEGQVDNLRARATQALAADAPLMTVQPDELMHTIARGDVTKVLLARYLRRQGER